ncbi:MAG: putative quinol monooxygenase [Pirellulales bacterium]
MIHVIATIDVASGKREAFLEHFRALVPEVREEQGCLDYGPTVDTPTDIAAQVEVSEDSVTVVERWESLDALKAHLAAPHMTQFRSKVADLVRHTTLRILTPV